MQSRLKDYISALGLIPSKLGLALRLLLWKPLFAACGRVRFGPGLVLAGCAGMSLADGVRLGRGCQLYALEGRLEIGADASISPNVIIDASNGLVRLGRDVLIGPGTVIRAANHCYDRLDVPIRLQGHSYATVVVGDDVWIGANCTLTPGCQIVKGTIVGAGAVVVGTIPAYSIVGGVPARLIGSRAPKMQNSN